MLPTSTASVALVDFTCVAGPSAAEPSLPPLHCSWYLMQFLTGCHLRAWAPDG